MLPEEWPIRPPADRGILAPVVTGGRDRLSAARQDFFLPAAQRLTEQERALMTAMLHRLVEEVSAEIQLHLPQEWLPANEDLSEVIDRLSQSGLLDREGLMSLLLRRADEERIASAFNARPGRSRGSLVQAFVSDQEAEIAAAAMAVLIARGRRKDRYGQALVELDDVPAQDAAALVHGVSAALCERRPPQIRGSDAVREFCGAAETLFRRYDAQRSLDRATAQLISMFDDRARLDEAWIKLAIDTGEIQLIGHALARRARIAAPVAAGELLSGDPRRIMLLLRVADSSRELAGHLLAVLGDLLGLAADLNALNFFESFTAEQVAAARTSLQLDPHFKSAWKALGHGHGAF